MSVAPLRPAVSRRNGLYGDPHLVGFMLLIALAWDDLIEAGREEISWDEVEAMTGLGSRWQLDDLKRDVPRYESPDLPP